MAAVFYEIFYRRWAESAELLMEAVAGDLDNGVFSVIPDLRDVTLDSIRRVAEGPWPGVNQDIYKFANGVKVKANVPGNRDEIPKRIGWEIVVDNKVVVK